MSPTEFRKLRQTIKYTQLQMALLMGVSREAIQSWESGKRSLSEANALLAQTKVESVQNALSSVTNTQTKFKDDVKNLLEHGHNEESPIYNEAQLMMITMANAATCSVTLEFVSEILALVSKSNLQQVKDRAKTLGKERAQRLDAVVDLMF